MYFQQYPPHPTTTTTHTHTHATSFPQNNSRRNMNPVIRNFSLLASTSNYKATKFSSQISLRLWIQHSPTLQFQSTLSIFNSSQKIQKDSVHSWCHTRKSWNHLAFLFSWLKSGVRFKFVFSPPRKRSWATGFEIWFDNHLTTDITFNVITLKHCISNIKFLEWIPADFSLPWSNAT